MHVYFCGKAAVRRSNFYSRVACGNRGKRAVFYGEHLFVARSPCNGLIGGGLGCNRGNEGHVAVAHSHVNRHLLVESDARYGNIYCKGNAVGSPFIVGGSCGYGNFAGSNSRYKAVGRYGSLGIIAALPCNRLIGRVFGRYSCCKLQRFARGKPAAFWIGNLKAGYGRIYRNSACSLFIVYSACGYGSGAALYGSNGAVFIDGDNSFVGTRPGHRLIVGVVGRHGSGKRFSLPLGYSCFGFIERYARCGVGYRYLASIGKRSVRGCNGYRSFTCSYSGYSTVVGNGSYIRLA